MRNAKCTISVHRSRVSQLMGRANPVWLVSLVLYALMRPGLLDSNIHIHRASRGTAPGALVVWLRSSLAAVGWQAFEGPLNTPTAAAQNIPHHTTTRGRDARAWGVVTRTAVDISAERL